MFQDITRLQSLAKMAKLATILSASVGSIVGGAALPRRQLDHSCCFQLSSEGLYIEPVVENGVGDLLLNATDFTPGTFCVDRSTYSVQDNLGRNCYMGAPDYRFRCHQGTDGPNKFQVINPYASDKAYLTYENGPTFFACPVPGTHRGEVYYDIVSWDLPDKTGCEPVSLALKNELKTCHVNNHDTPEFISDLTPTPTRDEDPPFYTDLAPTPTPTPTPTRTSDTDPPFYTQLVPTPTSSYAPPFYTGRPVDENPPLITITPQVDYPAFSQDVDDPPFYQDDDTPPFSQDGNDDPHFSPDATETITRRSDESNDTSTQDTTQNTTTTDPDLLLLPEACYASPTTKAIAPFRTVINNGNNLSWSGRGKNATAPASITPTNSTMFLFDIPKRLPAGRKATCGLQFRMPLCADLPAGYPCYHFEERLLNGSDKNGGVTFSRANDLPGWDDAKVHQVMPGATTLIGTFECDRSQGPHGWLAASVNDFVLEFLQAGVGRQPRYEDGVGLFVVECEKPADK